MTSKRQQARDKSIELDAERQRLFDESLLTACRLRHAGDTLRKIGAQLGVGQERARQLLAVADRRLRVYGRIALPHLASTTERDDWLVDHMEKHEGALDKAPLSTRATQALHNAGKLTVDQLVTALPRLPRMKNVGALTVAELHGFLRALGPYTDPKHSQRSYSVYQRITLADKRTRGCRLSSHDVMVLASDIAVQTLAENDDEDPHFRTRPVGWYR